MIDMKKRYRTRDGRDVRLLCVDGPAKYSVVGLVENSLLTWTEYGYFDTRDDTEHLDLIEVRTAEEVIADCKRSYPAARHIADALRKAGLLKEGDA